MAQDKENKLPYVYVDIDQVEPSVSHIYNNWTHPAPGYKKAQPQQARMYDVNAQYPPNQGRIEMEADPSSPVIPLVVPVFHKVVEHDYSPQPHPAQHARQTAQSYQQSYQQPAAVDPANSAEAYPQNQMAPEHQQVHIKKAQRAQQAQQPQQTQQSQQSQQVQQPQQAQQVQQNQPAQQAQQPQQAVYESQPQSYQQPAAQSQPPEGLYMNEQENADQLEIQPYQPQYAWYSPYGYPYADPYGYGYGYDAYAQYPQYAPPQVYQQPQPYGQPYPQDFGQQYPQPYGQPYPQDYGQPYPQPYGQQYPPDYGQLYPQDYGQQYPPEYNPQSYPQNYNYAYQQPYTSGYGYPQQGIPGTSPETPVAQPYANEPQQPQQQASHGAHASSQSSQPAQQPSTNQQLGSHQQPISDASGASNDEIGAPLLDQQAIQDSPIFDEPPVSIADGMKTLEDSHKKRKRLLIASLIALAVVAIALVVVLFILISGAANNGQTAATTTSSASSAQMSSQSSMSSSTSSSMTSSSKSSAANANKSGTVVYQYSAKTTSGVQYSVKETVTFQSNGDCEFSTMELTFPDEASATEYVTNLARDYGSNFTLDSQSGANAVVTIDNSGLHLDRDEYENALRYSVEDLVILKK